MRANGGEQIASIHCKFVYEEGITRTVEKTLSEAFTEEEMPKETVCSHLPDGDGP